MFVRNRNRDIIKKKICDKKEELNEYYLSLLHEDNRILHDHIADLVVDIDDLKACLRRLPRFYWL